MQRRQLMLQLHLSDRQFYCLLRSSYIRGFTVLSTHIPFVPCQSAIPFLTYDIFKIWPRKSRSSLRSKLKVTIWVWDSMDSHPFCSMSIDPSIPEIQNVLNWTLKIQGEGEMTIMLHNYRSRQLHITVNGINPSSGFRDMPSTKSDPSADPFDKFWAMSKPIWSKWAMEQMGKLSWQCTTQV